MSNERRIGLDTIVVLITGNTIPAVAEQRGEFHRWIEDGIGSAWEGTFFEHDLRDGLPPAEALSCAGIVITGSPASVTERAGWMLEAEAFLREAVAQQVPILGICFGHQLLAQALGGQVTRNPRGREIGTIAVRRLEGDDPLFAGLGVEISVNATHVDSVTTLPPEVEVLAESALEGVAAFRLGSARGVQFHPEIDGHLMRGYLSARRETLEAEGLSFETLWREAQDTPAGPTILRNFASLLSRRAQHNVAR